VRVNRITNDPEIFVNRRENVILGKENHQENLSRFKTRGRRRGSFKRGY